MSDKVQIIIEGKADGVKMAFDQVVTGSERVSSALANTSAKGAQAFSQLSSNAEKADTSLIGVGASASRMGNEVEQGTGRAAKSFDGLFSAAQKIGAGIGALALLSSQAAGESEAAGARLEGAFENAGIAIADYADSIDQIANKGISLAFDDEDVTDAIATLIATTKDYEQTIADVQLAENIARQERISLAAATNIVQAAETGRFRALAQLGIVLGDTATKEDYLAAAQDKYAGAAERFASTGAASWERYKVAGENALEALGSKISSYQTELVALSAGTSIVGTIGGALQDVGATSALAGIALGPAGLAAAALAAGAGILYLTERANDYTDAAVSAAAITTNLTNFFTAMASAADPNRAKAILELRDILNATIIDAAQRQSDLDKLLSIQMGITNEGISLATEQAIALAEEVTGFDEASLLFLDTNDDLILSVQEVNAWVDVYSQSLDRLTASQQATAEHDIASLFSQKGLDFAKASAAVKDWQTQLDNGTISGEQFVALIHNAAVHFSEYLYANNEAAAAAVQLATSQNDVANAVRDTAQALSEQGSTLTANSLYVENLANAQRKAQQTQIDMSIAVDKHHSPMVRSIGDIEQQGYALQDITISWIQAMQAEQGYHDAWTHADPAHITEAVLGQNDAIHTAIPGVEALAQRIDDLATSQLRAQAALDNYAESLGQIPAIADTNAAQLGANAAAAGAAIGDAFRVGVGNVQGIGSQAKQVDDWARSLINVKGEIGTIDDLLARGVITTQDYNAAQDAGTAIFAANAAIQDDVLEIQTKQAPIIAKLTEEQQRYMDHLADLPADQQAVRLAYMDTNESLKAQQALALAAAAANGELGAAGEASAQSLIAGAAAADPYLKSLLTDMGVISVGADGTITVNFDDVVSANTDMDTLIGKLDTLIDLIAESLNIDITSNALTEASNLQSLNDWLNNLNGKHSTVYIDTVGNLGPTGGGQETALHGGVMGYARGGVVARMAEGNRPELLHFRGGGTALAMTDGLYNVPQGTYVTPAPATRQSLGNGGGVIHINNPIINLYPPNADVHSQLQEWATGGSR